MEDNHEDTKTLRTQRETIQKTRQPESRTTGSLAFSLPYLSVLCAFVSLW